MDGKMDGKNEYMYSPEISLCITTMNRYDKFLCKSLIEYVSMLDDGIISEIVISDETGDDNAKISIQFKEWVDSGKIRLFCGKNSEYSTDANGGRLGPFLNKLFVCEKAKYSLIALIDSDNFAGRNYFECIYKYICDGKVDIENFILSPSIQHPCNKFTEYSNGIFRADNVNLFIKSLRFQMLLNTGNFVLSKNLMQNIIKFRNLYSYFSRRVFSCDVIYFCFLCFSLISDFEFHVIDGLTYEHAIHEDSIYIQTNHIYNHILYDYILPSFGEIGEKSLVKNL
jgi:hypothetical protein